MDLHRSTTCFALAILVVSQWGCAASSGKTDEPPTQQKRVQGTPPEREPPDALPKGAPVKMDANEGRQSASSQGRQPTATTAGRSDGDREYVSESDVEQLMRRGPSYVFRAVTVEPVKRDGSFRGYRIVEASEAARRVMQPQLEVGDLVQTVNGVSIERPGDYMEAWKKLKERTVLEVEFRRDGETHEAHWVVDERAGR